LRRLRGFGRIDLHIDAARTTLVSIGRGYSLASLPHDSTTARSHPGSPGHHAHGNGSRSRKQEVDMAKGQKKSNREAKKPKAAKAPAAQAVTVSTLMSKGSAAPAAKPRK
jgi:hypothetical protein